MGSLGELKTQMLMTLRFCESSMRWVGTLRMVALAQ